MIKLAKLLSQSREYQNSDVSWNSFREIWRQIRYWWSRQTNDNSDNGCNNNNNENNTNDSNNNDNKRGWFGYLHLYTPRFAMNVWKKKIIQGVWVYFCDNTTIGFNLPRSRYVSLQFLKHLKHRDVQVICGQEKVSLVGLRKLRSFSDKANGAAGLVSGQ